MELQDNLNSQNSEGKGCLVWTLVLVATIIVFVVVTIFI